MNASLRVRFSILLLMFKLSIFAKLLLQFWVIISANNSKG